MRLEGCSKSDAGGEWLVLLLGRVVDWTGESEERESSMFVQPALLRPMGNSCC